MKDPCIFVDFGVGDSDGVSFPRFFTGTRWSADPADAKVGPAEGWINPGRKCAAVVGLSVAEKVFGFKFRAYEVLYAVRLVDQRRSWWMNNLEGSAFSEYLYEAYLHPSEDLARYDAEALDSLACMEDRPSPKVVMVKKFTDGTLTVPEED